MRSAVSFRALPLLLPLALSAGCSEEPVQSTQLLVGIHAGGALTDRLSEVRIAVYPLDAAGKLGTPTTQTFAITKDADAAKDGAREVLPLSFGITRGKSERLRLLVEGYVDDEPAAVVEHKLNVGFLAGSVASVKVLLTNACYRLTEPCGEDTTCDPESQACRDVEDVSPLRSNDALDGVDLPDDPACRNNLRDCDAHEKPRVCVDGLWEPAAHCATSERCEAGSCVALAPATPVACPGPFCVEPVPAAVPGECTDNMKDCGGARGEPRACTDRMWVTQAECSAGELCTAGTCVRVACAEGARDCLGQGGVPRSCRGATWVDQAACAQGQQCLEGTCTTPACDEAARDCAGPGGAPRLCTHGKWEASAVCTAPAQCMAGACVTPITPVTPVCENTKGTARSCSSATPPVPQLCVGGQWAAQAACAAGTLCEVGECKQQNLCPASPCSGHGSCVSSGPDYVCTCEPGYRVSADQHSCTLIPVDPCNGNVCQGTATYVRRPGMDSTAPTTVTTAPYAFECRASVPASSTAPYQCVGMLADWRWVPQPTSGRFGVYTQAGTVATATAESNVVYDTTTGLEWLQGLGPSNESAAAAETRCASAATVGARFHVPSYVEMLSLLSDTLISSGSGAVAFDPTLFPVPANDIWYQTSTVLGTDTAQDRMMIQGLHGIGQTYGALVNSDPARPMAMPVLTRCVRAGARR